MPLRLAVACLTVFLLAAGCLLAQAVVAAEVSSGPCSEGIPELFKRVSPAVVMITGQSINPYRLQGRVTRVLGSGFLIEANGLILTNSHVVYGLQSLTVTMDDGSIVAAKLVGADPIFDLAVVQIPKPRTGTLPTVKLGDSDRLQPGEEVIAIGNPLGLDQTVTRGIISGINRILPETPLSLTEPLIQTDTAINPGNSGGPLLNRCGEVIGINTAIVPEAQSIGFSVPINLAKTVLPSLLKDGRVIRPWIGFHGQLIGPELRKLLQVPLVDGLLVEVVEPGSPADKVGIRGGVMELSIGGSSFLLGGDIVVSLNGAPMNEPEKLSGIMRSVKVGSRLKLKLFREGKYLELEYTLPERPLLPGDLPDVGMFAPGLPSEGKSDISRRLRR
jgi:S1-C subfamily serine protease